MVIEKVGYDYKIGCYTLSSAHKAFVNINGSLKKSTKSKREIRDCASSYNEMQLLHTFEGVFINPSRDSGISQMACMYFDLFERLYSMGYSVSGMCTVFCSLPTKLLKAIMDDWKYYVKFLKENKDNTDNLWTVISKARQDKLFGNYITAVPEMFRSSFEAQFCYDNYYEKENFIPLTVKLLNEMGKEENLLLAQVLAPKAEDVVSRVGITIEEVLKEAKEIGYTFTSGSLVKQINYVNKAYKEYKYAKDNERFRTMMEKIDWSQLNEALADFKVVIPNCLDDCRKIGADFSNCAGGFEWNNYLSKGARGLVAVYKDDTTPIACVDFEIIGDKAVRIPQALGSKNKPSDIAYNIGKIIHGYITQKLI